jgi:hypothetical protein
MLKNLSPTVKSSVAGWAEPQARFNASQVGRTRLNGKTGGAARLPQRPAGANESQEWRCVS